MKRRDVLQKLAYTVPAGFLLPGLVGCEPKNNEGDSAFTGKVSVIGAGPAGLYTAFLLQNAGVNVEVFEASNDVGGRMRYLEGFSDFPLELGADELIGNDHQWYRFVEAAGITIKERTPFRVYNLDGQLGDAETFADDVDFLLAQGFREQIPNYLGPDVTVAAAINKAGIKERVHFIMDAEIGNAYGTNNSELGMRVISEQQKNWKGGDGIHILEGQTNYSVLKSTFSTVIPKISFNTPIVSINYTGEQIELGGAGGESFTTDMVVVTTPLSILKSGDISFTPALPAIKQNALNSLGMDAGLKAALAFNGNFWGNNTSSIITEGPIQRFYAPGLGRSVSNSVLAIYAMGSQAEELGALSEEEVYQVMLDELDAMFNGNASRLVVRDQDDVILGVVQDWAKEPYIKGAYSYPKIGASLSPEILGLPVDDRVFFAGEATATNYDFGTVQGALTSAERVLDEVREAIAKILEPDLSA